MHRCHNCGGETLRLIISHYPIKFRSKALNDDKLHHTCARDVPMVACPKCDKDHWTLDTIAGSILDAAVEEYVYRIIGKTKLRRFKEGDLDESLHP